MKWSHQDIVDLKEAYALWQSLEFTFEYGPLRAYREHEHDMVQKLWRKTIDPAIVLVHENIRKTHGTYVAEAPSPWHIVAPCSKARIK